MTLALITKIDVSLNLQKPAEEVCNVITLILSMYPGRQLEILRQIDEEVGSALARLEHAAVKAPASEPEQDQPSE